MKKIFTLLLALGGTIAAMAANVGDTIPYYYMGDTLWYKCGTTQVSLCAPCKTADPVTKHYWGNHTLPSGVVYVPDTIEVDGVKKIVRTAEQHIFDGVKTIDEVHINKYINNLFYAFANSSVKKVYLGAGVNSFGNGTFKSASQLDSVFVADENQIIGSAWDTWLASKMVLNITEGFLRVGNVVYAFRGLPADSVMRVPDGVVGISSYATYYCNKVAALKAAVLPASMTQVRVNAFYGCTGMQKVTCLATVPPTLDPNAFLTTDNSSTAVDRRLTMTLYVPWSEDHSVLAAYQSDAQWSKFALIQELGSSEVDLYTISARIINSQRGTATVNDVTLHDGQVIGMQSGQLLTLHMTPNDGSLVDYVKWDGTQLDTTGLAASGIQLDDSLADNHSLEVAFKRDPNRVMAGDTIPYYYMGDTLWYWYRNSGYLAVCAPCPKADPVAKHYWGNHTLPSGVVYVPDSIELNGVMTAVNRAESHVFEGLQTIDEVHINKHISSLFYAFASSSVKKVYLGAGVNSFGNATFRLASQLDSVFLDDDNHIISSAWDTWLGSKILSSVTDGFLRVGNAVYAYKGFPADSVLCLPAGVVGATSYITYHCSKVAALRAVVLPASMLKVSGYSFWGCTGMQQVTCYATVPPELNPNAFKTTDAAATAIDRRLTMTLYVPWSEDHSVLAAYQADAEWSKFAEILELPQEEDGGDEGGGTGTALSDSAADRNGEKLLRDGQIMIIRNGRTYDVMGREVK